MNAPFFPVAIGSAKRVLRVCLLLAGCASLSGCVVETYPHRYYYRTAVVYTPYGPRYVRERVYYRDYGDEPAYYPPPAVTVTPPPPAVGSTAVSASPSISQLQPLVAPIALYPDPLIAVLLPASTFPEQLQDARAWVDSHPKPSPEAIEAQAWEPSVKAVAHYPTVLDQMTNDVQWTRSLGSAFASRPSDVMAAIQNMRAQAAAVGSLTDTPQQDVVRDAGVIAIEPADPDVIYVPTYDPVVVYVGYHPLFFSDTYYAAGPWFVDGCDWAGGVIFVGDWHGGYYYRDHHWERDYAWHADHVHAWARDRRFGPPPRIDAGRYQFASGVRGREGELRRSMTDHASERDAIQHSDHVDSHGSERDRSGGNSHGGGRPERDR